MFLEGKKVIHVSAWSKMFTQFRMPLIRELDKICESQLLYCPYDDRHTEKLIDLGFQVSNGSVSSRPGSAVIGEILKLWSLRRQSFDVQ